MLCKFGLKMPFHAPFAGVFLVKMGVNENFCSFIAEGCNNLGLMFYESNSVK